LSADAPSGTVTDIMNRVRLRLRHVAAAVALTGLVAGLAPTPAPTPAPAAAQSTLTAAEWCRQARPALTQDPARAFELLSGMLNLGRYGIYILGADPDWRDQAMVDTAGNRHVASLDWVVPLIREGLRRDHAGMLERARFYLNDWITTFPPKRKNQLSDMPLIAGKRLAALDCAAALLGDEVFVTAAANEAARMEAARLRDRSASNTGLVAETSLLRHACAQNDPAMRDRTVRRMDRLASLLVNSDGSDIEGSPAYARYILELLNTARSVVTTCGLAAPVLEERHAALSDFLVHSVRPDFTLDTIGDTTAAVIRASGLPATSLLRWATTKGKSGTAPTQVYASFPRGGYTFARSAWDTTGVATYYSVRSVHGGRRTAHTHDDSTAVTISARGVHWIADPGPFRYENTDPLRGFIKGRSAHSALMVAGKRAPLKGSIAFKSTDENLDITCVRDDSWTGITLLRCVHYSRTTDVFVIQDRIINRRPSQTTAATVSTLWQIPPGVSVEPTGSRSLRLRSGTESLNIQGDASAPFAVRRASSTGVAGWHTTDYGVTAPGIVISRRVPVRPGAEHVFTTVLTPSAPNRITTVTMPSTNDPNVVITQQINGAPAVQTPIALTVPVIR
jgi:hypothetical protein